jgi:Histidine phosphatase superfamily (branch 2)
MASFLVAAVLAASSAKLVASQAQQTTWGTVVMSLNGECTPEIAEPFPNLTPLGAQQAVSAGSAIRTRYVQGPGNNVTDSYPIPGVSTNTIDNTQLYLLARDDDYIAASAQAFMQGLYPPLGVTFVDQEAILANGSLVQYPLGGYQYATIDTISPLDFNYVWYVERNSKENK